MHSYTLFSHLLKIFVSCTHSLYVCNVLYALHADTEIVNTVTFGDLDMIAPRVDGCDHLKSHGKLLAEMSRGYIPGNGVSAPER